MAVLRRDHYTCQECGARSSNQVDHVVPVTRGGSDEPSNLQTLCEKHHRAKTKREARAGVGA